MLGSKAAFILALMTMVMGAPVSHGAISIPLEKKMAPQKTNGSSSSLYKRADTGYEHLAYASLRYLANYTIGGQPQTGIIDTGSGATWVISNKAYPGGYDPTKSSHYEYLNNLFQNAYGTGNLAIAGTWAKDEISFGGGTVPSQQFAYINQTVDLLGNDGIFALGPKLSEGTPFYYPTFIENLKNSGQVSSNSFSLYSKSDTEAGLIISGIDTEKFEGSLNTVSFRGLSIEKLFYYTVPFSYNGQSYNGILDTGAPIILLPQSDADALAAKAGATWNEQQGAYILSKIPDHFDPLEIELAGITVTVPPEDLFIDNGDNTYIFGVGRGISEAGLFTAYLLGDPFIKQLFLTYDLDNEQIGFAPVKKSDKSNVVPIIDSTPDSKPAPVKPHACIIC